MRKHFVYCSAMSKHACNYFCNNGTYKKFDFEEIWAYCALFNARCLAACRKKAIMAMLLDSLLKAAAVTMSVATASRRTVCSSSSQARHRP